MSTTQPFVFQSNPQPLSSMERVIFDRQSLRVWNTLLAAEHKALSNSPTGDERGREYNDNLIAIRVLGHFLKDLWDHRAQAPLLTAYYHIRDKIIANCSDDPQGSIESSGGTLTQDNKLFALGLVYRDTLMSIFRIDSESRSTSGIASPISSSSPDVPRENHNVIDAMAAAPETIISVKDQALLRDRYRCMLSGAPDFFTVDIPEAAGQENPCGTGYVVTECAHVIPASAQDSDENKPAFPILEIFGLQDVGAEIMDDQVNTLRNVLTLSCHLRALFDQFFFWLEEVAGQRNTYAMRSPFPRTFKMIEFSSNYSPQRRLTFAVNPDAVNAGMRPLPPLPDRRLLALRAACSRVAHASGAVEQAYQVLRDKEDAADLAYDESSTLSTESRTWQL